MLKSKMYKIHQKKDATVRQFLKRSSDLPELPHGQEAIMGEAIMGHAETPPSPNYTLLCCSCLCYLLLEVNKRKAVLWGQVHWMQLLDADDMPASSTPAVVAILR